MTGDNIDVLKTIYCEVTSLSSFSQKYNLFTFYFLLVLIFNLPPNVFFCLVYGFSSDIQLVEPSGGRAHFKEAMKLTPSV